MALGRSCLSRNLHARLSDMRNIPRTCSIARRLLTGLRSFPWPPPYAFLQGRMSAPLSPGDGLFPLLYGLYREDLCFPYFCDDLFRRESVLLHYSYLHNVDSVQRISHHLDRFIGRRARSPSWSRMNIRTTALAPNISNTSPPLHENRGCWLISLSTQR